jgi:hypothetical protein
MELVFVGEVILKVAAGCKSFWAEVAPVASRESTEETVEVELTERRGDILTVLTAKEGKVARVHSGFLGRGERWGLIQSLACRGVGCMLVDEVRLKAIPIFERFGAEKAVVSRLVLTGVLVVMGPTRFGSDEQAVVAAEEELVVSEHKRVT